MIFVMPILIRQKSCLYAILNWATLAAPPILHMGVVFAVNTAVLPSPPVWLLARDGPLRHISLFTIV